MQDKKQIISPIKQRILHFAKGSGLSMRDFYLKTGISRGTLESNTGITEETLAKVIANFSNLSPLWLLTGDGDMLTDNDQEPILAEPSNEYKTRCTLCAEKERVIKAKDDLIQSLKREIYFLTHHNNGNNSQTA